MVTGSCRSSSHRLVGRNTYIAAARVLFNAGNVFSSDQHTIAVVHVVEFIYLTALVCKCINDWQC